MPRSPLSVLFLLLFLVAAAPAVPAGEIHAAVAAGDLARVEALLAADRSLASAPDPANQFQEQPLHIAARTGRVDLARLLVAAGAAVDAGDSDQSTPLDVAALNRQPAMVSYLLSAGADPRHRDNNGAFSLSFAAAGGDSACVRLLLDAGVPADNVRVAGGAPLLHYGAMRGLAWFCERLCAAGADVNARNDHGETPLHSAAASGRVDMIDWLIARGASTTAKNDHGESPLLVACWRQRDDAARRLLALGLPLEEGDSYGWGPLCVAAMRGNQALVREFTAAGCDVDRRWRDGWTALGQAVRFGEPATVSALLDAGASPRLTEDGLDRTPLHIAAVQGFGDLTGALLDHGACADARDRNGDTALDLAVRHGQTGVAGRLAAAEGPRPACNTASLAAQPRPTAGEAVVWYCGHSGWAVLTRDHLLVFDYWQHDRQADEPGLACGCVSPAELAGRDVVVFVSHDHADHWWPGVLEWRSQLDQVTYVFGFRPEGVDGYQFVEPRQRYDLAGLRVTTTRSTDAGVGFVVEADGVTIFHAGDHHNRDADLDGIYRKDIDWLAAAGVRPDLCFLPISGCGFGDLAPVHAGVDYTLATLQPAVFCPMHGGNSATVYHEFVAARTERFPGVRLAPVRDRGDRVQIGGKTVSAR